MKYRNNFKQPAHGGKVLKASSSQSYSSDVLSGYDATINRGRRRVIVTNNKSEDKLLRWQDRDKLISTARSLVRNSSIVSDALDRHLNFTATYTFQCRSADKKYKDFDKQVERLMNWWFRPLNCDAAGQHSFDEMIRMIESSGFVDGDTIIGKLNDGRLQLIEADRIRTPNDVSEFNKKFPQSSVDVTHVVHGVRVDEYGKHLGYAISDRTDVGQNGYELTQVISAADCYFYGYRRRPEQIRGISRLAPASNILQDIYENIEYAQSKSKQSQMVGLKYTKGPNAIDGFNEAYDDVSPTGLSVHGEDGNISPAAAAALADQGTNRVDFSGGGPQTIELEPGDDAEFMTISTPSNEFQSFQERAITMGLRGFNQPKVMYDEANANYTSSKMAFNVFWPHVENTRTKLRVLLHNITVWRLSLFILDGELELPEGWTIDDINFSWDAPPMPSVDVQKDAMANKMLIDNKLTSRQRIAAGAGNDWFAVMDELKSEADYAAKLGISLLDAPAETVTEKIDKTEDSNSEDMKNDSSEGENIEGDNNNE